MSQPAIQPPAAKPATVEDLSHAFADFSRAAADLGQAYERLTAAVERRSRGGRLELVGEQFARLAHQLRTPLSAALLYAAPLRNEQLLAAERARFAGLLVERLRHMERMLAELLAYTRGPMPRRRRLPLAALLFDLQARVRPLLQAAGARLELGSEVEDETLEADAGALIEAIENLIDNALRARPDGACLGLRVQVSGSEAVLTLADNGPGIAPELAGQVFRPFVTTRSDGTGLGLPVALDRVRAQGGSLRLLPTPAGEAGARFEIRLPLAGRETVPPRGQA